MAKQTKTTFYPSMPDCVPYVGTGRHYSHGITEQQGIDAAMIAELRTHLTPGEWLLLTISRDELREMAGRHGVDPGRAYAERARLRSRLRELFKEE